MAIARRALGCVSAALGALLVARALTTIRPHVNAPLVPPPEGPAPSSSSSSTPPTGSAPAHTPFIAEDEGEPETLEAQRARLFDVLRKAHGLSDDQMAVIEGIFQSSPLLSQGNPEIVKHPLSRAECRKIRSDAHLEEGGDAICGMPYMTAVYDPTAGQKKEDAKLCIDQFEFPDVPCEYPVVHVRANEAAALCGAMGKRLCDAHEWEGACAGALKPPAEEYDFSKPRKESSWWHNHDREKVWAYGPAKDHAKCGTDSFITKGCPGGGWKECGSNTYPTGSFPLCVSQFGVFDQHGNVAEHMSIPTTPDELGTKTPAGGDTEMKGSWFAFQRIEAHEDDCRWRAPDWHPSKVLNENSHRNYHLGFRCCRDLREPEIPAHAANEVGAHAEPSPAD